MNTFKSTNVSVAANSNIVVINDGASTAAILPGHELYMLGELRTIESVTATQIILEEPWPSAQNNISCRVIATVADFVAALEEMRKLNTVAVGNLKALQDFITEMGEVEFKDFTGGTYTLPTLQQLIDDVRATLEVSQPMQESVYQMQAGINRRMLAGSGFLEWGKHSTGNVNNGLWTFVGAGSENAMYMGRLSTGSPIGVSKTNYPVINVDGGVISIINAGSSDQYQSTIKLPPAPDGLDKADGTGRFVDLAEAIAAGGNSLSASVLNRQDLAYVEVESVIISDGLVLPLGSRQYGASTWNGQALSNALQDQSISAFYDGDTVTKGYTKDWPSMSPSDKAVWWADPKNNITQLADGQLQQEQYAIRTHAGGEGSKTIDERFADLGFYPDEIDKGLYRHADGRRAIPIALVGRYNQGAYHPSYNPNGTSCFTNGAGTAIAKWHTQPTEALATKTSDCFNYGGGYPINGGNITVPTVYKPTGEIGGYSGRPDGRFYDGIYAARVNDLRLSAHVRPQEEVLTEGVAKLVNGEARGWEKVPFMATDCSVGSVSGVGANKVIRVVDVFGNGLYLVSVPSGSGLNYYYNMTRGEWAGVETAGNQYGWQSWVVGTDAVNKLGSWEPGDQIMFLGADNLSTVSKGAIGVYLDTPNAEHTWTDVIGDPARIAATFPDGVAGQWIPVIPDGAEDYFPLNRKGKNSGSAIRTYTKDSGSTWTHNTSLTFDTVNDLTQFDNMPANQVMLYTYSATAHFTEDADNSKVLVMGDVFMSGSNGVSYGCQLASSTIGKILTGSVSGVEVSKFNVIRSSLSEVSQSIVETPWQGLTSHPAVDLATVNSPAFKTLFSLTEQNGRYAVQMHYTELKHNGTNWGDDGLIHVTDGQSTRPDTNGNTVVYGCATYDLPFLYSANLEA